MIGAVVSNADLLVWGVNVLAVTLLVAGQLGLRASLEEEKHNTKIVIADLRAELRACRHRTAINTAEIIANADELAVWRGGGPR